MTLDDDASASPFRDALLLVGRVLVAFLFVPAGFGKLVNFGGTVAYIAKAGLPVPEVAAVVAIVVELGFGLALLVGFRTRWVAPLVAAFTIVTAFGFHHYWTLEEPQRQAMKIHFGKNMAIAGGLLAFAACGPGRFALDRSRRSTAAR